MSLLDSTHRLTTELTIGKRIPIVPVPVVSVMAFCDDSRDRVDEGQEAQRQKHKRKSRGHVGKTKVDVENGTCSGGWLSRRWGPYTFSPLRADPADWCLPCHYRRDVGKKKALYNTHCIAFIPSAGRSNRDLILDSTDTFFQMQLTLVARARRHLQRPTKRSSLNLEGSLNRILMAEASIDDIVLRLLVHRY